MSIDVENEEIITLMQACRLFPPNGVSPATMARWVGQRGVRGVRLATIVIGGRRLTSREAVAKFIAAQNSEETPSPTITQAQRQRQAEAAQKELARAGV
jgi:hypothetical protein